MKRWFFRVGVYLGAWLARSPFHNFTVNLMRSLAQGTLKNKKAQRQDTIENVAREWQRMFPLGPGSMPVTRVDKRTTYLEIREYCPLQGTGDLGACDRMMQFDHTMLAHIGAQLVVIRSQAVPGNSVCEVALRMAGDSIADLKSVYDKK